MTVIIPPVVALDRQDRLKGVEPALSAFALRVPQLLGGWWRVVRGTTTDEEQELLYQKGRTIPGENCTKEHPLGATVTEARYAHETAHGAREYGACAIDLVAMNDDGTCDWNPKRYMALGELAKRLGFEWGGDFKVKIHGVLKSKGDFGHVQVAGWRSIPLRSNPEVGNV